MRLRIFNAIYIYTVNIPTYHYYAVTETGAKRSDKIDIFISGEIELVKSDV